jgi:tRNA (cytidine/uridine-2'-O-)-methyltransferase
MLAGPMHNLKVALIEPEIPGNTGSIGRTCLARGAALHLVRPLGFQVTDEQLRRSGLDYWQHVALTMHDSLDAFLDGLEATAPLWLFTTKAKRSLYDADIKGDSMLIFGPESRGLSRALLDRYPDRQLCIPMESAHIRSINLSNAVSVALYEAWRQQLRPVSAP